MRRPGIYSEYGPEPKGETWDEFYLNFEPSEGEKLAKMGFEVQETAIWPLSNMTTLLSLIEELAGLSRQMPLEQAVDRVDRVCERIVLEVWIERFGERRESEKLRSLAEAMKRSPAFEFDLAQSARIVGMSPATFRRRWAEEVGGTPRRYQESIRLQEAARLLIETREPVREIAERVGFEDEFYFTRRFNKAMGSSPRSYRAKHRM